jgi:hypothetical protein
MPCYDCSEPCSKPVPGGFEDETLPTISRSCCFPFACDSPPDVVAPPRQAIDRSFLSQSSGRKAWTLDAQFEALGADIPGFAGLTYGEDGQLVLHLTVKGSADQAKPKVASYLDASGRLNGAALAALSTVRPAKYEFAQLAEWRRGISRNSRNAGLISTDIDEGGNRLVIGALDAASAGRLRLLASQRGIPNDAIAVEVQTRPIPDALLTDSYRPIYGSLQMTLGGGAHCTLGYLALLDFNSYIDSTDVYAITNTHCTDSVNVVNGQIFCQNDCIVREGYEVADPPRFQYGSDPWQYEKSDCPDDGSLCRYSDAALFLIDSAQIWHGAMGVTCSGITLCDTYNLVNWAWPFLTESVRSVGASSGYSTGTVDQTCVNLQQGGTGTWLLCQYRAGYTSVSGDSGAPVVTPCTSGCGGYYNATTVLGLNWGHNTINNKGLFSPIAMVSNELGVAMSAGGLRIVH